jgi:tRNA-2-methylthio-N6-dimethylallyladenosine synthase
MIPSPKKVFVKTYGCQMNVYDSERMRETLAPLGYAETAKAEDADLIILNTCHIREKAAEKIYSELGKIKLMKQARAKDGHAMTVAVAGCVAQAEGAEIIRRQQAVDVVVGPQTYHRLPAILARHESTGKAIVETELPVDEKFAAMAANPVALRGGQVAAFLTVQEGCDKFCSFCVVPYTRGAEFSRPVAQVLEEARKLAGQGVREVTLLGQNVNAYRGPDAKGTATSLANLISQLAKIDGLDRIRYTTSHPRDMGDDLIAAHATEAKLMPYLHLPIQSGNDRILKAMNRGHKVDDYRRIIERVRAARADMAVSGDFIVGFPGETDQEFEDTLSLVREMGYASAYCFKYSARPGTPAAERDNQVPEDLKTERLLRLQALVGEQQHIFNRSLIGKRLSVLVEKPGRRDGQMIGRSPYLQSVHVEMPQERRGDIVTVTIADAGPNSLTGELDVELVAELS